MKPTFTKVYGGKPGYPIDKNREKWRRADRANEQMKRFERMFEAWSAPKSDFTGPRTPLNL